MGIKCDLSGLEKNMFDHNTSAWAKWRGWNLGAERYMEFRIVVITVQNLVIPSQKHLDSKVCNEKRRLDKRTVATVHVVDVIIS